MWVYYDLITKKVLGIAEKDILFFKNAEKVYIKNLQIPPCLSGKFIYSDKQLIVDVESEIKAWQNKHIRILKETKRQKLNTIIITTSKGHTLQGDPNSQIALSKAIQGFPSDAQTIPWIDANNNTVNLTVDDLKEALSLAIQETNKIYATYNTIRQKILAINDLNTLQNGKIDWDNADFVMP